MNNLSKTFTYLNENGDSIIFEYSSGYLINKPIGIDTIQVSLSKAQGINQVGATVQSKNVQPRAVNITGIVVGDYQSDKKEKLLSVIRPDLEAKLYCGEYYLQVCPTATPTIECKEQFAKFTFSLLAPYPYWQRDEHTEAVLSGLNYKFKLPAKFGSKRTDNAKIGGVCTTDTDYDPDDYTYVNPYQFAVLINTQFLNIRNIGDVAIPFTVSFMAKGNVTNPKLTNAVTNKYLQVNKTMTSGDKIVVEITHGKTYVTSSVDGDIRGALSLASGLFELAVGDNILKPEADAGLANLDVSIDYALEKVGIVL